MSIQTIVQEVASVANVLSVVVLAVGYYYMVRLYREWVDMRRETHVSGGRPMVVVTADYGHLPQVNISVRNFAQAPAKEVSFDFSAPVEAPDGTIISELRYFKKGLPFLEPQHRIDRRWGSLPELAKLLRERELEDGIQVTTSYKDLAGESYENEWTLDPLLFEGSAIENSKGMNDLVNAVECIPDAVAGRDGHHKTQSSDTASWGAYCRTI